MKPQNASTTMVESKTSIYDEDDSPPLVHATLAMNPSSHESDPLLHASAMPSAPPEEQDDDSRRSTSPPAYRDVVPPCSTHGPRDFVPTESQGGRTETTSRSETSEQASGIAEDTTNQPVNADYDRMVYSGSAGAVVGLLLGGPFLAALLGFGSAYATQKEGAAGDAARALGEVARSASEKAKELDEKHKIVDRSKKAAAEAWEKAQELDRQHHILDQLRELVAFSWRSFADFMKRHRVLERGVEGVGRGFEYVAERVSGGNNRGGNAFGAASQNQSRQRRTEG